MAVQYSKHDPVNVISHNWVPFENFFKVTVTADCQRCRKAMSASENVSLEDIAKTGKKSQLVELCKFLTDQCRKKIMDIGPCSVDG